MPNARFFAETPEEVAGSEAVPAEASEAAPADEGTPQGELSPRDERRQRRIQRAKPGESDPLQPVNRGIFWVNERFDQWAFEPVARGWRWVFPYQVRHRINLFFVNLRFPSQAEFGAAIFFGDHQILTNVHKAPRQVTGVGRLERGIRQTFARRWVDNAPKGWWYIDNSGNWKQK